MPARAKPPVKSHKNVMDKLRPQPKPSPAFVDNILDKAFESPPNAFGIRTVGRQAMEREHDVLSKVILEEQRELGRASFWYFITQIVYPDIWQNHYTERFHKPIVDSLQNLHRGQDLWVFLQREARKSFITNILHNMWLIIKDPNIRLLLVGAREETVKPFARLIKSAFTKGTPGFERFQRVYSECITEGRGRMLQQAFQFTVPNRTSTLADPTFRAAYLGVTGAGWRCDVLDFDDPIERRNVFTPEGSDKALSQMLDLLPLVDSTSKYQNIKGAGTRYSYHDPYGKLLGEAEELNENQDAFERFKARDLKVIMRHAFESPDAICQHCPPHIVAQWPHGHPVPPEDPNGMSTCFPIHTRESLIEKLEQYRIDPNKGEALWWHQYQNVCMSPASQKFKNEWFDLQIDKPSWPVAKKRILAVDSADKDFQKKGLGDFMVAMMGEFDDIGRLCLRYALRSNRWTRDEFIRRILAWCQGSAWWPQLIAKEKFGEDNFLTDIGRSFRNVYHPTSLSPVSRPVSMGTMVKKFDWIVEALQGPMERGEVVFGSTMPPEIRARCKYEGTNLGQTSHDDIMDTLALFFAQGVRVNLPNRAVGLGLQWVPPSLNLYEPSGIAPPNFSGNVPKDPIQTQRTEILIDSIGFNQIHWNPSFAPQINKLDDW